MSILFSAITDNANFIKVLAELLSNNIKEAHFEITQDKLYLCKMDQHKKILIELTLYADRFIQYQFNGTNKLYIGLNLMHFHKILKSVKTNDFIQLSVYNNLANKLEIKIISENGISTSQLNIQHIQNIEINVPNDCTNILAIYSKQFQKSLKQINGVSSSIMISIDNGKISFRAGDIVSKLIELDSITYTVNKKFTQIYDFSRLYRILKISNLSSYIKVLYNDIMLAFRSNVGKLGNITIYIKSKEQLENEKITLDNDNSDDE
jgi:hypothetical protein